MPSRSANTDSTPASEARRTPLSLTGDNRVPFRERLQAMRAASSSSPHPLPTPPPTPPPSGPPSPARPSTPVSQQAQGEPECPGAPLRKSCSKASPSPYALRRLSATSGDELDIRLDRRANPPASQLLSLPSTPSASLRPAPQRGLGGSSDLRRRRSQLRMSMSTEDLDNLAEGLEEMLAMEEGRQVRKKAVEKWVEECERAGKE